MSQIKLSIALVTRNRPDSLERTLKSLREQDIQPFEVVISDDSNLSAAIKNNKALSEKYNCNYVQGPGRGLYANRNFVAMHCSGTHVRTMDDDHEFPKKHIEACLAAIKSDPQCIWTIGEYYPTDEQRSLPPPIPGQLHARGFSYPPKEMSGYFGISCGGTVYPRSIIDKKILNLENYKFGNLYLEYGARLVSKGFVIKFIETTYLIHHYDENNRSILSSEIINGAKIFSMLMLSFYHKKSAKNVFLTLFELVKGLLFNEYSIKLIQESYYKFKLERANLDLQ